MLTGDVIDGCLKQGDRLDVGGRLVPNEGTDDIGQACEVAGAGAKTVGPRVIDGTGPGVPQRLATKAAPVGVASSTA